jgi:DNA invertase Pin-like site-specific DNA recombinase
MTVRFYTRVSTEEQASSGLGLMAQARACIELAGIAGVKPEDWDTECYGDDSVPGQYTDGGVSAWKKRLEDRPAGRALLEATKPGDTIIMSRIDRGFRSTIDFCQFIKMCIDKDIKFLCHSPRVNLATANGRAAAQIFAVVAEWESSIKSERIKEGLATKRRDSVRLPVGGPELINAPSDYRPRQKKPREKREAASGRVHIYARCSHQSSVDGNSIASQMFSLDSHRKRLIDSGLQMGSEYIDAAVSALSVPLKSRPSGSRMDAALTSGDHVVFVRVDRAFGTTRDFLETIEDWDKRGITIHFSEDGSSMNDAWGRMLLVVLTHFSEMERRACVERNRDARRSLRSQGKFQGGRGAPPFWRVYVIKNVQRLILDSHQIACFRYILMCKRHGVPIPKACELLEEKLAAREGRPVVPQTGCPRRGKYRALPEGYMTRVTPGKQPLIYPLWTRVRFHQVKNEYQPAIEKWASLSKEEKRRIKVICRNSHTMGKRIYPVWRPYRNNY